MVLMSDQFFPQVRVSAVLTNGQYMLNLDCDHYINNSSALREAMCFLMDPNLGRKICYVQFPQRFDGIDTNDRYANRNTVFFDVSCCAYHFLISLAPSSFNEPLLILLQDELFLKICLTMICN